MTPAPPKVLILGGGISGLTLAYRLEQQLSRSGIPPQITLLEGSSRFGGILETKRRDDFIMEAGADSFITDKPAALELAQELGLQNQILQTQKENRRSFILNNAKLQPVPQGFYLIAPGNIQAFLQSSILTMRGKFRVLLEPFIKKGMKRDESVKDFIVRRFGVEAYEKIGQAMIGGIYSGDAAKLSLQSTMLKLWEMEQKYGSVIKGVRAMQAQSTQGTSTSGPRYSLFVSFKEGLSTLPEALCKKIKTTRLLSEKKVTEINKKDSWEVQTSDGDTFQADILCSTLSAAQNAELLSSASPTLSSELAQINHTSAVTVNLVGRAQDFPSNYKGFGFVVPQKEKSPVIGCTFSSLKWAHRAPKEHHLIRVFLGGVNQDNLLKVSSDQDLIARASGEIQRILGFKTIPELAEVKRYQNAMPQYELGHIHLAEKVHQEAEKLEQFYLLSNAFGGVGIPDRVMQANKTANEIVNSIKNSKLIINN